jgi:hypothetical protein
MITTAVVRQPRIRDRSLAEAAERFDSKILPPYLRKELIPWLYCKRISTGQLGEALAALLGPEAHGLSSSTTTRLKGIRQQEYAPQQAVAGRQALMYVRADGVYFSICLEGGGQ